MRIDPATRFVRSLKGEYFLLREAAEAVGTSQFVLRKFISDGDIECSPSKYAQFGKTRIYLYTREDIESIRQNIEKKYGVYDHLGPHKKPGRPPKYNREQRKQRARMYSKSWYWRNRAKVLGEQGKIEAAQAAMERAKKIDRQLHED